MLNFFQIPSDGRNLQTGTKIPRGPRLEHAEENHANYRKKNKVSLFYFLKINFYASLRLDLMITL